jgi:hypothetical protein
MDVGRVDLGFVILRRQSWGEECQRRNRGDGSQSD